MSELIIEKPTEEVIIDRTEIPLNLCFETFGEIHVDSYREHATLRIGNVAYVKDAP